MTFCNIYGFGGFHCGERSDCLLRSDTTVVTTFRRSTLPPSSEDHNLNIYGLQTKYTSTDFSKNLQNATTDSECHVLKISKNIIQTLTIMEGL